MKPIAHLVRSSVAVLLAGMSIGATSAAEPILLKTGTILPQGRTAGGVRLQSLARTNDAPQGGLFIIQHEGVIPPEWREALEAAGATIRGYIPENAYLIQVSGEAHAKVSATMEYSYLGEYRPEYRIDPKAAEAAAAKVTNGGNAPNGEETALPVFDVSLFEGEMRERVLERLKAQDGAGIVKADGRVIRARLTEAALRLAASWIEVESIELHVPNELHNNVAVQGARMNVETVWPGGETALDLTGRGQVVAVADTGLDTGNMDTLHADVRGRVVRAYALARTGDWSDLNGHGTHVSGSVLGNGANSTSPKIRGVAYEASLILQSIANASGSLTGIPNDLTNLLSPAYATENGVPGARIHSDSWGSSQAGAYSTTSRDMDRFMFDHPDFIAVVSAGNEGADNNGDGVIDTGSIGAPATAKNCISVGSCENYRTSGGAADWTYYDWDYISYAAQPIRNDYMTCAPDRSSLQGMAASSSRGPCKDGRIKPDVIAPGQQILSLLSSRTTKSLASYYAYNSHYRYNQGTSMAAPLVAGSAALVRQWLVEEVGIDNPDGATIKAALLAGARSITPGQYGTGAYREVPASYPNNVEGWGLVNLGNTVANETGVEVHDGQIIASRETQTFPVEATSGKPLVIVMAYADAPGSTSASKQLVNDLDLKVTTPSGTVLYPNSRTTADRVNNVEGVRIASAEAGTYTITVNAYAINTPMATTWTKGRANATRYSLVVNGAEEDDGTHPKNDNFGRATTLENCSGTATGSNVGATFQIGEPLPSGTGLQSATNTVWWKWTAPVRGSVQFDTIGTDFDTILDIYTGPSLGSLTQVGEDDDGGGKHTSKCTFACVGGTTYYIRVSGYNRSQGDIILHWKTLSIDELASLSLSGPESVRCGATITNVCTATWSSGASAIVTPVWSIASGTNAAAINAAGVLTGNPVTETQSVTVLASYTEGDVTQTATRTVTVRPPALDSLTISGLTDLYAGKSRTYTCTAKMSDGTQKSLPTTWEIITGKGFATVSASGVVTAHPALLARNVTLLASCTWDGVTKTATLAMVVYPTCPLAEALDNTTLSFTTGGDADWFGQRQTTDDGTDAAHSGLITHYQNSWLQTTVTGPGTISFRWYASSESFDRLAFLVDGSSITSISGTATSWKTVSYAIGVGSHTLKWNYSKDISISSGLDAGFVDRVVWTPAALESISISGATNVEAGVSHTYTCTATMSNGASETVTPRWSIASGSDIASISPSGVLTTATVTAKRTVTLQASYTLDGVTKTATKAVTVLPKLTLAEALDNDTLNFTTGGAASWFAQGTITHDGVAAARSGAIGNNQSSWLRTTVTGPGTISFWWYASSEGEDWDYLEFLVDGVRIKRIGGLSASWTQVVHTVGEGSHTLKWNYTKDFSFGEGEDAGFVDQVVWGNGILVTDFFLPREEVETYMKRYPELAARAGNDLTAFARLKTGKFDAQGNEMCVGQDIVAGTDPTDVNSRFTAKVRMQDGKPVITWQPALNGEGVKTGSRLYTVLGSANLQNWEECPPGAEGNYKFFKVTVEMPKE